jgi:hypothetical protein
MTGVLILFQRMIGVALLLAVLGFFSPPALAEDEADAGIKATYLHNFTKFVEWPALVNDTIHICVVGSELIVNKLGEIASRDLKGHALQIWSGLDDPQICQILFISRAEKNLKGLMDQVRGKEVLTVSDADGFARQGGGIGFYSDGNQIKLEINSEATQNAHLRLNAMLMEIARVVH